MNPTHDTPHTALVTALGAADSPGASALVTGSTARLRRRTLDEAVHALAALRPRRAVVHLNTPGPSHRPFAEALATAVDEALHALHAPDSLDDAQGPMPVGSWMFRARAAHRDGLLVVIDDLDAWLDARGGASSVTDALALLQARRRSPLSVLASARAASASGAPALAPEVLAAFDRTVSLGAAPATVTRDPSTLVAALAGRTFHLSGLQSSIAKWLELPPAVQGADADDTLIVFSSPLASPALPDDPPVAWSAPPTPPAPPPTAPRAPAGPEEIARWSSGLRTAIELGTAVRRARLASVTDPASAERAFLDAVARIPAALAEVGAVATSTSAELRHLDTAAALALAQFEARFEAVLRDVEAGRHTVLTVEGTFAKVGALAAHTDARATAIVAVPGLRCDHLARFESRVLAQVKGLARADEHGVAWSLPQDEATALPTGSAVSRQLRGSTEVHCLGAYTKLSEGVVSAAELDAAERAALQALRVLCAGFAGRTAVLVCGDRAAPGARSAFSVIVPWSLYTYGGRSA